MFADKIQNDQSKVREVYSHDNYLLRNGLIFDSCGIVVFRWIKKFKFGDDIRIYADKDMRVELLSINNNNNDNRDFRVYRAPNAYVVSDSVMKIKVGAFKLGTWSTIKSGWIIMDAEDREIGHFKEEKIYSSFIRDMLPPPILPAKYYAELQGERVCLFKTSWNRFVYQMSLDYSMDWKGMLDRRLGIAAAILSYNFILTQRA